MTQQAIRAHVVQGSPVLVLGCPGGRVRVVQPGAMAEQSNQFAHGLGSLATPSADLGFGGAALATKQMPNDTIRIWFGTMYGPTPHPAQYVTGGELQPGELATGEVHTMTWTSSGLVPGATKKLSPIGNRGGYAVAGLAVADLLPEPPGQQVDELIVCTLAGDVIVLNADTLVELWRAHVPGAVGAYNSILVADADGDDTQELYVCGSLGIWRFQQP